METAEQQGAKLPFLCRNGACTSCAVKVIAGDLVQPEAMGLSPKLKDKGYAKEDILFLYRRSKMYSPYFERFKQERIFTKVLIGHN